MSLIARPVSRGFIRGFALGNLVMLPALFVVLVRLALVHHQPLLVVAAAWLPLVEWMAWQIWRWA